MNSKRLSEWKKILSDFIKSDGRSKKMKHLEIYNTISEKLYLPEYKYMTGEIIQKLLYCYQCYLNDGQDKALYWLPHKEFAEEANYNHKSRCKL